MRGLLILFLSFVATAPVAARDELPTASAASVGIDGAAIAKLTEDIHAGKYRNIHSLLVVRSGKLVAEAYFQGEDERRGRPLGAVRFDANTLHDLRSVTKSVTSALFGIAMAAGAIRDIDAPVLSYFPEYKDLQTPERLRIRLRDVLSMTSGLQWDRTAIRSTARRRWMPRTTAIATFCRVRSSRRPERGSATAAAIPCCSPQSSSGRPSSV
jgi:CubicO group peptidase (beta-lactamase class C family)